MLGPLSYERTVLLARVIGWTNSLNRIKSLANSMCIPQNSFRLRYLCVLEKTFTRQMKDHCGLQVILSKADPLWVRKACKMAAQTVFGGRRLGGKMSYFHTRYECTFDLYRCLNSACDHSLCSFKAPCCNKHCGVVMISNRV